MPNELHQHSTHQNLAIEKQTVAQLSAVPQGLDIAPLSHTLPAKLQGPWPSMKVLEAELKGGGE